MADVDTSAPARPSFLRRHRVAILVLLATLLAAASALAAARSSAASGAEEYERAAKAWADEHLRVMLDSTRGVPEAAFAVTVTQREGWTKAERTAGCRDAEQVVTSMAAAGKELPTLDDGPFGWTSADRRAAAKESDRRGRAVARYAAGATEAYRQIGIDCRWALEFDALERDLLDHDEEMDDRADRTTTSYARCEDVELGCVPISGEQKDAFASAGRKSQDAQEGATALLADETCAETSLGRSYCRLAAKSRAKEDDLFDEYLDLIERSASTLGVNRIGELADEMEKAAKKSHTVRRKAIEKTWPSVTSDLLEWFADNPDELLHDLGGKRISRIAPLRADLRDLG